MHHHIISYLRRYDDDSYRVLAAELENDGRQVLGGPLHHNLAYARAACNQHIRPSIMRDVVTQRACEEDDVELGLEQLGSACAITLHVGADNREDPDHSSVEVMIGYSLCILWVHVLGQQLRHQSRRRFGHVALRNVTSSAQ